MTNSLPTTGPQTNRTSEAVVEVLRIDATKSFRSPMDERYIAICQRAKRMEKALEKIASHDCYSSSDFMNMALSESKAALSFDPLS